MDHTPEPDLAAAAEVGAAGDGAVQHCIAWPSSTANKDRVVPAWAHGLVAAAMSVALTGVAPSASAQEVLRASTLGPPSHLLNSQVLRTWADEVASATAGRVKVEVLPKPVAAPTAVLGAVRDGLADVAILSNGASEKPLPLNALVEFAGQTPSAERASVAYQHVVTRFPALGDEFEGVELLAVFTHGPGALLMARPGRADAGAMSGATLHAGSAGAADAARALGARVVMGPGPAAKALLADAKVDGTVTAVETLDSFALGPNIREVDRMPGGFYTAGFSLIVNRKRWESLSAADRTAITQVSGEHLARLAGRAWDEADASALKKNGAAGLQVVDVADAVVQRVRAASAAREEAWRAGLGVSSIDAGNALAEYREELGMPTTKPTPWRQP